MTFWSLVSIFSVQIMCQVQVQGNYPPKDFSKSISSPKAVVSLPILNNLILLQAAKAEELINPGPFKFGEAVSVELDITAGHGEWSIDNLNGRRVWKVIVKSQGALSLSFLFSEFYLPPGGEFYVLGQGGKTLGAFTGAVNNKDDGKFATAPIADDQVMLEYSELLNPPTNERKVAIKVHKVVHGFRKTMLDTDSAGKCNIDVMCPEGNGKVYKMNDLSLEIPNRFRRNGDNSRRTKILFRRHGQQRSTRWQTILFDSESLYLFGRFVLYRRIQLSMELLPFRN